jgi:hypothetical protein
MGLTPRRNDWRKTANRKVTLTSTFGFDGVPYQEDWDDDCQLDWTGQFSLRRAGSWCEIAVSLRGRDPGNSETSAVGRCHQSVQ